MTSVVNDDYPIKTLVVVDDNSTDQSLNKARELLTSVSKEDKNIIGGYIEKTPTIIIHREESGGPSAARNTGIKILQGVAHYVAPLDADDMYLPGKLSKSMAVMLTDPLRIGLVYSDVLIYNEEKSTYVHEFRRPYSREILERENIISNAPLISMLALQRVGLYCEQLRTSEDHDFWLRITEEFVAIHIPEPLQQYRVTGKNATHTVSQEQWNIDRHTVYQRMLERKQR